jgi:glutamine synthetase
MTNVTSDLEFAGSQIGGVAGATSAAAGLKGFKTKISAAKSVKAALGNYKNAAVQMKDLAAEAKKALDNIKNLVS